ncbi:tetraacyldisaccharide 4'-kinase [Algoriphagus mannitolivorans]|uniref:tetraacyldisaccharide 4'-kinase n=1 Tax=Algoriphagus mannitolivorans TaxID=226504 RepID=UPI0004792C65|nr:tetraacyldisaccharide 4'-kinase [Algoriphagus mannitolivorans]
MPWYSFLLAPFALIFRIITSIRNGLYDRNVLKSQKGKIFSLVVGNLSVGGTGKTPMVEYLLRALSSERKLAVLSRGYGRNTKGFLQSTKESAPSEIGDEPLQIFQKFGESTPVFVCENRVKGIERIYAIKPDLEAIVLDDAFQHRSLKADVYILLTPFQKPFTRDFIMPVGRLRESRCGAQRADLVVVSKCPENLSLEDKASLTQEISSYLRPSIPVIFSSLSYCMPLALGHSSAFSGNVLLISGLADDRLFLDYCKEKFKVLEVFSFPDHHEYSRENIKSFIKAAARVKSESPVFLCTEKDGEKLKSLGKGGYLGEFPIFVLPIEVKFEPQDKEILLTQIRKKLVSK